MITTTLNEIRKHSPCQDGWEKLLTHLGKTKPDDKPLPLLTVLNSNGMEDCLWALRAVPEYNKLWRKYAVWCARQVEYLMTDERSKQALDVAWRHAEGQATDEELAAAWEAANAGAHAAWAAAWAASAVAGEAYTATRAAYEAAEAAASVTREANATAYAAARAASAAEAAYEAAYEAAARKKQEAKLRVVLASGEWMEDV